MFKVTESEIHIFAKELNTIIIIDRESFLESYFTLIEIDEPINDVRKFIVLKNMLIIIFNFLILKIEPC